MVFLAVQARSGVVISEIMYDPVGGGTNEFVELYNAGTNAANLSGWYFPDGITYTFAAGTMLQPGAYLVVAANRAAFALRYPAVTNLASGFYNGQLNNGGERLTLADAASNIVFDVTYNNASPWPAAAAGLGSSLVLADPAGLAGDPSNWQASANLHGSPGGPGGFFVRDVVINEVLAHTDPPQEDAVELRNLTTNAISLAGWFLSDDNTVRKKYRFPAGSTIAAGGYLVVYQADMNGTNALVPFSISSKGDDVYLSEADTNGVIVRYVDQVQFEPTKNGVAVGRYPDGTGVDIIELASPTFGVASPATVEAFRTGGGARNASPYVGPVVINEIMYHPSETNFAQGMRSEYVEILNRSASPVPLYNPDYPEFTWSLTGGISFSFPTNIVLAPGELMLVVGTNDLAGFRSSWGVSNSVRILGPFSNALNNAGDTVRLRAPNNPEPGTNVVAMHVEETVKYNDRLPWPLAADGLGGSLERTDPASWSDMAANWHSIPDRATPGATNTVYVPPGAIVISELMAVNRHTLRDEDGDFSDWLELYNTTDQPVSLAGWHLTDQSSTPALWTFPAVTIQARGSLVVFCSQKNRTNDFSHLHTNFALDEAGEYLALFRSDLVLEYAFDPAYPPQAADVAYGLPGVGGFSAVPIQAGSAGRYLVPTNAAALDANWAARLFNDGGWLPAGNGIGYDTDTTYLSLIQTDLKAAMLNKLNSAFVRYPFVITNSVDVNQLLLRLKYEDGFDAWLNGVRIASNNVAAGAGWNAKATATRSDTDAVVFEDRNVSAQAHLLVDGTNVLALQVLNVTSNSSDLVLLPELHLSWAGATGAVPSVAGYLAVGTPGSGNGVILPGVVAAPVLSNPGGLFAGTMSVTASCATVGAAIRYTLDGTDPTTNSAVYAGPFTVSNDTEIVVRAFLDGWVPSPTAGAVYRTAFLGINEILASNVASTPELKDYTDFGDWIEIYNGGPSNVDLGGYHLSDSAQQPFRWQIPTGTVIAAGGFLHVWADGGDIKPGMTLTYPFWPYYTHVSLDYHANFKLGATGEAVGLFSPAGSRIDFVTYGTQVQDISYGRYPDGAATWAYFGEPTARTNNRPPALLQNTQRAPKVTISPPGPLYTNGTITVTLTSGAGVSAIRYTTNGAAPTSASILYTNGITLTTSGVIRARAYGDGLHPGPIATRTYLINERKPDLPIISLVIDPYLLFDPVRGIYTNVIKEREVPGNLEFYATPTNSGFQIEAGFRIFGLNTFLYAQKPFTAYLNAKYGMDGLDYQLFPDKPLGYFDRFVLRNGNDDWPADPTHGTNAFFRDTLGQTMLKGVVNNAVQGYRPCAIYLNGGYYGLINIQEKMDEMYCTRNYGVTLSDIDFFEMDGTATTDDWILDAGTADGWNTLMGYLATNNLADPAAYAYVSSQVDIEDMVDYVAGQVFVYDSSWFHNRKWWRDRNPGGKWRWCFVDLDRALRTNSLNSNVISAMASGSRSMAVFRECMSNTEFRAYAAQRIMAHLNSSFSTNRTLPIIDREAQRIRNEMGQHCLAYGTRGGIPSLAVWDEQVDAIRSYVRQRPAIAMQHVASLFGTGQTARVAVKVTGGAGRVMANCVSLSDSVTNTFVAGLPLRIRAVPEIGQSFLRWEFVDSSPAQILAAGSAWKYVVATNEIPGWMDPAFVDAAWPSGFAQLGYGDGDEATVITNDSFAAAVLTSAYFRRAVLVTNAASVQTYTLRLLADDGAVVYVNGREVLRQNMTNGSVAYTTLAVTNVTSPSENYYTDYAVSATNFVEGTNVLAVEVHQAPVNTTDLGFDMALFKSATVTQVVTAADTEVVPASSLDVRAVFAPSGASVLPSGTLASNLTLTAAGSPYYATGDIFVPSNTTFALEPGTTLLMPEAADIRVQGHLQLLGTTNALVHVLANTNDNARLGFNVDPSMINDIPIRWGAISFEQATHTGEIVNTVVRGATVNKTDPVTYYGAISAYGTDLWIDGLDIEDAQNPIVALECHSMVLRNSRIRISIVGDAINATRLDTALIENCDVSGSGLVDTDAIDFGGMRSAVVRGNRFHDFMGINNDAVDLGEACKNVLIESNFVYRIFDKAVSIGGGSSGIVRHNQIHDCDLGAGIKDGGSYGLLQNNTYHKVGNGVALYVKVYGRGGGTADIQGCIFSECVREPVSVDSGSTGTVSYCLSDTLPLEGASNLLGEPRFERASAENFRLQTGSPAIDAGSPASAADADGSRADIGALAFDWRQGHAVITEIQYHPADTNDAEYVELHNPGGSALNLSGWRFGQGFEFEFPPGSSLASGGYLLICSRTNGLAGVSNVFVWTAGTLDNAGEGIQLLDPVSNEMDRVAYGTYAPWPSEPDGAGPSLSLINPRWDNALPASWYASGSGGGTPGRPFDHHFTTPLGMTRPTGLPAGSVRFGFGGPDGVTYILESTADLLHPNWQPAGPVGTASGGQVILDHTPSAGTTQLFYRVRVQSP